MKKALIVIDLQKGFTNELTQVLPEKIRKFIKGNGKSYDWIVFTQYVNHLNSNFVRQFNYRGFIKKEENEIVDELKEFLNKDNLFIKDTYSSFVDSKLLNVLRKHKIKEVHLAGIDTENCVLTFARDAFDRGYKVTVLKNLSKSHSDSNLHRVALKIIEENMGEVK